MARFAPVCPIQVLEGLLEEGPHIIGDYHLLLAHHTVEHPGRFTRLLNNLRHAHGDRLTVIMDNSVVECGGAVDDGMMGAALDICNDAGVRPIAVLPDVMGDGEATRKASIAALGHWEHFEADFLAVAQGPSFTDFKQSFDLFASYNEDIDWISVPRILVESIGTRVEATRYATQNKGPTQKIHLLGFSDNMIDDWRSAQTPGVDGIDSAVPLRFNGIFSPTATLGPRPKDWFDTAGVTPTMVANLHGCRESLRFVNNLPRTNIRGL